MIVRVEYQVRRASRQIVYGNAPHLPYFGSDLDAARKMREAMAAVHPKHRYVLESITTERIEG